MRKKTEINGFTIYENGERTNSHKHQVPSIEIERTGEGDPEYGHVEINLTSSHPNATIETSGGLFYVVSSDGNFPLSDKGREILCSYVQENYPELTRVQRLG